MCSYPVSQHRFMIAFLRHVKQKMLDSFVYIEPVVLAGITSEEVVNEGKCILVAGDRICCRCTPLIHAAYVGKKINHDLRVGTTLGGDRFCNCSSIQRR